MTQPASLSLLLSLPAEILGEIGAALAVADYANLRLTCQHVDRCTFSYFARQFFHRRKFFRGPASLDALLQISQSRLAPYLEHVVLGTELLERDPPADAMHLDQMAYMAVYCEQTSLLASGWDRDALVQAFSRLPKLRAVEVEDFDDRKKFDRETGQLVDTMNGGYGLRTLVDRLGFDRPRLPPQRNAAQQWIVCVQTLLSALARSTGPRPRTLKITGREIGTEYISSDTLGVDDDAFRIPPFLRPSIAPVVEALEELDLDVHNRFIYMYPNQPTEEPPWFRTRSLRAFLALPKRLRKLRISRFARGQLDGAEQRADLWAWLAAKPGVQQHGQPKKTSPRGLEPKSSGGGGGEEQQQEEGAAAVAATKATPSPALAHLRELHLDTEAVTSTQLFELIKKVSPTLEKLTLSDVLIRDRDGPDAPPEDGEEQDEIKVEAGLWADLCDKMATTPGICDRLYEVHLAGFDGLGRWHMQNWDGSDGESAYFRRLRISGEPDTATATFSYRGPQAKEALEAVAADLRAAVRGGRHVFKSDFDTVERRKSHQ